jgi:uncharacterized OB-fold protein
MSDDFPLPDTEWPATREFWAAATRGELVIPRCAGCGAWNWYPRDRCRVCDGAELPWAPVSGRGTLFSWAVVRRALLKPFAAHVPYATGLVALDEDPEVRLVTTLVDCSPEDLQIEMPMTVVYRALDFPGVSREVVAPMFTPAPRTS